MKADAVRIIKKLRRAGFKAYIVGGAVRDLLMGRRPKDYDIATSARPGEVCSLFPRNVPVGAAFGVVMVSIGPPARGKPDPGGGKHPPERFYQVATFRRDLGSGDGRRPGRVLFTGDEKADVLRRDFTINGLLLDPLNGRVLDFVKGKRDIERRVIRTIGAPDRRFSEDRLRMLRAVRFATTLGFDLSRETRGAVKRGAPAITGLSWERIAEELRLILVHPARGRGARLMHALGLLQAILPEVAACEGVPQDRRFHPEGDVLKHTFLTLEHLRKPDFPLALAALLHDAAKPKTRVDAGRLAAEDAGRLAAEDADRIRFHGHDQLGAEMAADTCRRLKLSRMERDKVVDLVRRHMHFMNLKKMREAKLRRFLESPAAAAHIELHRADCLASLRPHPGRGDGASARGESEHARGGQEVRDLPPSR